MEGLEEMQGELEQQVLEEFFLDHGWKAEKPESQASLSHPLELPLNKQSDVAAGELKPHPCPGPRSAGNLTCWYENSSTLGDTS